MDPKGFSDFIQKHGQIVGVEPVKGKTEFDEDSFIYKFEDGATVHYTPAVLDKSGKEIEPAKFIPDESKPSEAARKATTAGGAAQESIAAPAGQPWVARTGPINEEHPDGIYWTRNKNHTEGAKKASGQPYKNASGQWVQRWDDGTTTVLPPEATPFEKPETASATNRVPVKDHPGIYEVTTKQVEGTNTTGGVHYEDEAGNRVPPPGAQGNTSTQREPVPGFPGIYIVKAGTKDAQGNTVSDTYYENEQGQRVQQPMKPEKPTLIDLPNGRKGNLVADANAPGGYRVVPIEGTGVTGSQAPDISDTNAQYGQIADTLRQKAVQLAERAKARIAAGEDSATVLADYTRDLTTERELQQAKINEIGSIAQEQRLIQTGERGEGQSRRGFATTASTNAINTLSKLPQTGREFFESVRNLQGMQKQFAESIPGTFPDVNRTPLQKSIMSMGMDGKITIDPTALVSGGTGGAGGAQPPDLSTIGADFGVAQASGNGLPGPGAGVGPMGENLTRPGFSEGMTPPPFESLYDPEELLEGTGFEGTGSSALQSLGLA